MIGAPVNHLAGIQHRSMGVSAVGVIGGSGFIGGRLIRDLSLRGSRVRVVDLVPPNAAGCDLDYKPADVRDLTSLAAAIAGCGAVINLAAAHRDDIRPRRLYDEINVGGARNVCRAAVSNGIETILFTSSVAVYGDAPENADETQPHRPLNDYGRTKSEAERVYLDWQAQDPSGRRLVIVRPTVVFGPGNRGNVHNLISQVAAGRFLMVGDGANRKSMAYVDNVSGFISHLLQGPPGQHTYNYVDKPDFTMNELIATIRASLGKSPHLALRVPYWLGLGIGCACDAFAGPTRATFPVSRVRVKKFCASTVFSADKALTHTSYVPRVPLHVGLRATIAAEFG